MKKFMTLLTIVVMISIILLTACSSGNKSGKDEEITITFQTLLKEDGTSTRELAMAEIVKDFTEKTGINVKYITLPWQEIDSQLILAATAGNAPDVSYVHGRAFFKHMSADSLEPLNKYIERDLSDADKRDFLLWDRIGMHEDQKYVFPIAFTAETLLIRKDLLDKAGLEPPRTWEEFVEAGKAMQTPEVAGFLFGSALVQPNQLDFMQPIIEGRGGKVLDENGRAVFDSQAGIDSFEFLKSLIYDSEIMPKNAISMKFDDVSDAFSSGRAAMIFEGSNRYSTHEAALGEENLMTTYMPGVDSSSYSPVNVLGWTIGIPKGSNHPDEAWQFIKHLTSEESVLKYSKISGEVPTRNSTTDDEYYSSTSEGKRIKWWVEYIDENGTHALSPATIDQLNDTIASAVQEIIDSPDSNVEQILKEAVINYNAIVDGNN